MALGPLHSQFPAGLDTAVESDGSGLSEGEKQLICSLRAMLGESNQLYEGSVTNNLGIMQISIVNCDCDILVVTLERDRSFRREQNRDPGRGDVLADALDGDAAERRPRRPLPRRHRHHHHAPGAHA